MTQRSRPTRTQFAWLFAALLSGIVLRLPLLASPGTPDLDTWKVWGYSIDKYGLTGIYVLDPMPEPPLSLDTIGRAVFGKLQTRVFKLEDMERRVDYPPGTMYILWPVVALYKALISPRYELRPALNVAFKAPVILAELAISILLLWGVWRRSGFRAGLLTGLSFWLNPAILISGAALAYYDSIYGLVMVAGAIALLHGRPRGLWIGWAIALAMKLQPILFLPSLLVAGVRHGLKWLLGSAVISASILLAVSLPFIVSGHTLALLAGSLGAAQTPLVSAYQFNIWWLWSYFYKAASGGGWGVSTDAIWEYDVARQGFADLTMIGIVLFGVFTLFLCGTWWYRHRREASELDYGSEVMVLLVLQLYGATMLLTRIHENHLLGALPLLSVAAGWSLSESRARARSLWLIYAALSFIVGSNLLIFYGLGSDAPSPLPRMWFGFDGSVVLTALNIAVFAVCCLLWATGHLSNRDVRV